MNTNPKVTSVKTQLVEKDEREFCHFPRAKDYSCQFVCIRG
jgi:hypothetical protein